MPYSRGQLRSAKEEIVATLIHVKQEFDRQNIFVPCLVMDDGKTNPSALQLRALGLYILPCVAHVQCNSIQRVVKVNTMTYNGGIINVARLKALFTVRNALNDDEKLYVGIFWKHLQKYGKLSRYAKLAVLRNSGNSDYYTQSKFFLLNCAWRGRIIQHLPQLDTYFTLLVNVQRVQQLLEMRMTVENANELTRLADYLDLVSLDGIPFTKLDQFIRFFVRLFTATNIAFVPLTLSVMISYFFKDFVRMLCKSDVMPSLSEYMEVFQEWIERAFSSKFYSSFACMQLHAVTS